MLASAKALASNASVMTLCFFRIGKQGKCHDTLKKVHSLASCLSQKLVEAPPQTPIRISDFI
jgi:hypothetical protein